MTDGPPNGSHEARRVHEAAIRRRPEQSRRLLHASVPPTDESEIEAYAEAVANEIIAELRFDTPPPH